MKERLRKMAPQWQRIIDPFFTGAITWLMVSGYQIITCHHLSYTEVIFAVCIIHSARKVRK